ncbi:hypothetical protein X797_012090 [Metarhizium robertsii]|uniref:Uncharacterized protein n=1 Tax=Metarhizium robertsii TaxID=568076 RepID=A0A014PGX4_9HYPO|nr:hypothetical protein X797_012090 [Metarhizium robertsii]
MMHVVVRRGSVVTGHGPSKFSVDRYGISCDDVQFCANLDCREHHKEASIVHADCLKIFCRGDTPWGLGDNLRWLWVASTWRSPWRGALPLNAPPRINLDRRLDDLRLTKRMTTLPPELYAMIRDFSLSTNPMPNFALHHYNQLVAAFDLFREDVREEFLDRIESWTRGELPEVCEEGNKPFIRLSIDWQGLQSIEKMAVLPPAANLRSDCTGYVLGLAALQGVTGRFRVWDTPCPPPVDYIDGHNTSSICHLGTIWTETDSLTGITFFLAHGSLYAVHAHTHAQLSAEHTFLFFEPVRQKSLTWIYVPIQQGIAKFAFSQVKDTPGDFNKTQHILLHIDGVGDIIVGPCNKRPLKFLLIKQPRTLIYRRMDGSPIYFCDAFSREHELREVTLPNRIISDPPWQSWVYLSSAPLENVIAIRIFSVPMTKICRGVLIEYRGRVKRALGQCRLGVDPVRNYMGVNKLCFKNTRYQPMGTGRKMDGVILECHGGNDHIHQNSGWTCCDMRGFLSFWFTKDEMKIEHNDT